MRTCPLCHGTRRDPENDYRCPECGGTGSIRDEHEDDPLPEEDDGPAVDDNGRPY